MQLTPALLSATLVLFHSGATAGEDGKTQVEAPVTPGTVAALLEQGDRPEVHARWREALKHEAPAVRAAAARVMYVSKREEFRTDLAAALATEQDLLAAAEQIRALAYVARDAEDSVLLEAAKRLSPLSPLTANLLGRVHGLGALARLASFRSFDQTGVARRCLLQAATRGGRPSLEAGAEIVLREEDTAAWEAVWRLALEGAPIGEKVIAASMGAAAPRIRALTYWHAAMYSRDPVVLSKRFKTAAEAAPEAKAAAAEMPEGEAEAEALLAFELMQRARGEAPRENLALVRRLVGRPVEAYPGPVVDVARWLTADERALLLEHKILPGGISDWTRARSRRFGVSLKTRLSPADFPPEYMEGVLAPAGCAREGELEADVEYARDGRPRDVDVVNDGPARLSSTCVAAARVLFRSSFHSSLGSPEDSRRMVLEPGRRRMRISLGEPPEAGNARALQEASAAGRRNREGTGGPARIGGTLKDPKKLRDVRPEYPPELKARGVQGHVVLETVIGRSGHIEDIKVVHGVDGLTEAAAEAVAQWEFTPTLLNGVAVPVIYTVTVSFALP
jgi:protein TonB